MRLLEVAPIRIEPRSKSERGYRARRGRRGCAAGGSRGTRRSRSGDERRGGAARDRPSVPRPSAAQRTRRPRCSRKAFIRCASPSAHPLGHRRFQEAAVRLRSAAGYPSELALACRYPRIGAQRSMSLRIELAAARHERHWRTKPVSPISPPRSTERAGDAYDRRRAVRSLSERHAAGMLRLSHWFEARAWREAPGEHRLLELALPIGDLAPRLLDRRCAKLRKRSKRLRRPDGRAGGTGCASPPRSSGIRSSFSGSLFDHDDVKQHS